MVSSIDLKALNIFVNAPVSQNMIHKLVVTTLQVIPCLDDKKSANGDKPLPLLMTFINKLVRYTNVYTGTLMASLVYLDRLKLKLPKNAQGLPCTRHRIFLSCLILASKFHNDSSPKNVHWAKYTDGLFSVKDVNLMERQLLFLLDWDIKVSNEEMVFHLAKFLDPIREDLISSSTMKKYLQKQQQAAAQMQAHYTPATPQQTRTPPISRSSSTTSALSLGRHDRNGSVASSTMSHYRQDSCSSIESLSPVQASKPRWNPLGVDPMIEMTARNEELKLSKMLNHLCKPQAS